MSKTIRVPIPFERMIKKEIQYAKENDGSKITTPQAISRLVKKMGVNLTKRKEIDRFFKENYP